MLTSRWKISLLTGFAVFSMFFGSGNLLFPMMIGRDLGAQLSSILGFLCTGILMPFIGLLSMLLCHGDKRKYFAELPYPVYLVLMVFLFSFLGPLGVVPRCAIVAFGSVKALWPATPLWLFSAVFFAATAALVRDQDKVVSILGKYITPLKLGGILCITLVGLLCGPGITWHPTWNLASFTQGFALGYQTMDLPAALFFAVIVYQHIEHSFFKTHQAHDTFQVFKSSLSACLLGSAIIAFVYLCFIFLAYQYADVVRDVSPEFIFPAIASYAFGSWAVFVLALTFVFSCLATSLALIKLYVDFLHHDIFKDKMHRYVSIVLSIVTAYSLSLLGFQTLYLFMGRVLTYLYPVLIVFASYKLILGVYRKLQ